MGLQMGVRWWVIPFALALSLYLVGLVGAGSAAGASRGGAADRSEVVGHPVHVCAVLVSGRSDLPQEARLVFVGGPFNSNS
jgi:hypothetical protein